MDVDQPPVTSPLVVPDPLQQRRPAEYDIGVVRELDQQLELGRRQLDGLPTTAYLQRFPIQFEVAEGLHARAGRWCRAFRIGDRAPHHRPQPCHQDLRVEGFGHIVVGACFQTEYDVERVTAGRDHHDRDRAGLADPSAHRDPVQPGQHDVEHHDVGLDLLESLDRFQAVLGRGHVVAVPLEGQLGRLTDHRVVLDHENARCRFFRYHRTSVSLLVRRAHLDHLPAVPTVDLDPPARRAADRVVDREDLRLDHQVTLRAGVHGRLLDVQAPDRSRAGWLDGDQEDTEDEFLQGMDEDDLLGCTAVQYINGLTPAEATRNHGAIRKDRPRVAGQAPIGEQPGPDLVQVDGHWRGAFGVRRG